jgi:voltage-gated potassium channel
VHLLRLLGGTNRAVRVLRKMLSGRRLGYLLALTVLVIAVGTVGVYVAERGERGADILTLGDALWWASCLVTTINNELYPVSIGAASSASSSASTPSTSSASWPPAWPLT